MAKPLPHPGLGDPVRWKRPIDKSWKYGRLVSLVGEVVEVGNDRGRHSIRKQYVQRQTIGPRGGTGWEQLT